jgi:capsular exopolysaccharide synthesis family protein
MIARTNDAMIVGPATSSLSLAADELDLAALDASRLGGVPRTDLLATTGHALRRRWLIMLLLGGLLGAAAGGGAWLALAKRYTSTAQLRVATHAPKFLFGTGEQSGKDDYDIYKRTQRQLVTGPRTLTTALQHESIRSLPVVLEQVEPLPWLQKRLAVSFPDDAEIMQISVWDSDRKTSETLANAIVETYLGDVKAAEAETRQYRLELLKGFQRRMDDDLRTKRKTLQQTADTFGASESDELTPEQRTALQRYTILVSELERQQFLLARKTDEKDLIEAARDGEDLAYVTEAEVVAAAAADHVTGRLTQEIRRQEHMIELAGKRLQEPAAGTYQQRFQQKIEEARQKQAERKEELREQLHEQKRLLADGNPLDPEVVLLRMQVERLKKEADDRLTDLRKSGHKSIDVIIARAEYDAKERVVGRLRQEIHETEVEQENKTSRVTQVGSVYTPGAANAKQRLFAGSAAGGFAFLLTGASLVWWDTRKRRLNTPAEVSQELRLNLIGSLPIVRAQRRRRFAGNAHLAEAVDGVAATLLCSGEEQSRRVVLISSATAGEGKTTLATNLATSLAAAGRRTVLVDFDLRRPTLHRVFELEPAPGVSEVLAGQVGVVAAVQPTSHENLSIVTAGAWRHRALAELTGRGVSQLFDSLREEFEFIIVDASPVLPVVDTRLVSRHADGVIFSLLRDVSQVPKVASACRTLETFGANLLGGVMIGTSDDVYYGERRAPEPQLT